MTADRLDVVQLAAGASHSVLPTRQHAFARPADKGRLGLALTAVATDHRAMAAMSKQVAQGYLLAGAVRLLAAVGREQEARRGARRVGAASCCRPADGAGGGGRTSSAPSQNALRPGEFRVLGAQSRARRVPRGAGACAAHTVALAEDSKVYAWGGV